MKKIKHFRKSKLVFCLLVTSLVGFAQEQEDPITTLPEFKSMFECTYTGIDQHFVVHLKNESVLSIDFSEKPSESIQIYDKNNVLVGVIDKQYNQIKLPTFQDYTIQGVNSCGEMGVFFTFSTIPKINSKAFGLPSRIYEEWTKNFDEGERRRTIDFIRDNETLKDIEKLLVIQEYYFDGDLSLSSRIDSDFDAKDDFPMEFGFNDLDGLFLNPLEWTKINELIDLVIWGDETTNCICKTSWGFRNSSGQSTAPGPLGSHSLYLTQQYTPFRWYEHLVDWPDKQHYGNADFYSVYKNEVKGAAKRLNASFQKKRQGSDTYERKFPDPAQSSSNYKTMLTYTLACENNLLQDDNCMCDDRILEYQASYTNSVMTTADRFGDFGGFAATAQAEDWAILTLSSKKQGMKVIDGGRAYSKTEKNASINSEYNNRIIDIAATLSLAYLSSKTTKKPMIDSTLIKRTAEDIKYLVNNSRMNGGGYSTGSAGNELIGGCGTERSVQLRPNDPMTIMIHSFGAFSLYGHTRWKTSASIESNCYLAAYIDYKETEECCNEEVLNWVIGVNDFQANQNALRCINRFYLNRPVRLTMPYPNMESFWWTGNNEWGSDVSFKCDPKYFEAFVVKEDIDILPIGTEYFVSSMLTGNVLKSEKIQSEITLGDLKRILAAEGSFRHSFYALKLINNNEVQYLKIYID